MSISFLIQAAFVTSVDFAMQVSGIVKQEALYKVDTMPDLDQGSRDILASVVRAPQQLGFAETIIADVSWNVTYDTWAADPPAQDEVIRGGISKYFGLLTGFNPLPPPAPEPPVEP